MTSQSITSNQEKQFKRFVEDACERALKEVCPDRDGLQRLFERGGEFQAHVVAGIRQFIARLPNFEMAQEILGYDYISPEAAHEKLEGVAYTDEQILRLADTVPPRELLKWCKENGFALIPRPPESLSLLNINERFVEYFIGEPKRPDKDWLKVRIEGVGESHTASSQWIVIRKEPVSGSLGVTWQEQLVLVSDMEYVPNAAEVAWAWLVAEAVRWGRMPFKSLPFECGAVRTNSEALESCDKETITVGYGVRMWAHKISHQTVERETKKTGIVTALKL